MGRFGRLIALISLVLAFGMGSIVHAAEPFDCVDTSESAAAGHSDFDADQTSGDINKAYPHHHSTCHGHNVATPPAGVSVASVVRERSTVFAGPSALHALAPAHAELRPPIT